LNGRLPSEIALVRAAVRGVLIGSQRRAPAQPVSGRQDPSPQTGKLQGLGQRNTCRRRANHFAPASRGCGLGHGGRSGSRDKLWEAPSGEIYGRRLQDGFDNSCPGQIAGRAGIVLLRCHGLESPFGIFDGTGRCREKHDVQNMGIFPEGSLTIPVLVFGVTGVWWDFYRARVGLIAPALSQQRRSQAEQQQ
jgi:hypothetical protein